MTEVGEESAVKGVASSASTQLPLCLDIEFLRNTGCSVLALDSNFWSNWQKTRFLCGKKCTPTCLLLLIPRLFVSDRDRGSHLLDDTEEDSVP